MNIVKVTVKIKLSEAARFLNEDEIANIIQEMDYSFKHDMIEYTEIIEDDIYHRHEGKTDYV